MRTSGSGNSVRESASRKPQSAIVWLVEALLLLNLCVFPKNMSAPAARVDSSAVTTGCEKATCCTSRCYVDEHGVHHCVPKPGESCECGMSANDTGSALPSTVAIPPRADSFLPLFPASGWLFESVTLFVNYEQSSPTPPPRKTLL